MYKAGKDLFERSNAIKDEKKSPQYQNSSLKDIEKALLKNKVICSKKYTVTFGFIGGVAITSLLYGFTKYCFLNKKKGK